MSLMTPVAFEVGAVNILGGLTDVPDSIDDILHEVDKVVNATEKELFYIATHKVNKTYCRCLDEITEISHSADMEGSAETVGNGLLYTENTDNFAAKEVLEQYAHVTTKTIDSQGVNCDNPLNITSTVIEDVNCINLKEYSFCSIKPVNEILLKQSKKSTVPNTISLDKNCIPCNNSQNSGLCGIVQTAASTSISSVNEVSAAVYQVKDTKNDENEQNLPTDKYQTSTYHQNRFDMPVSYVLHPKKKNVNNADIKNSPEYSPEVNFVHKTKQSHSGNYTSSNTDKSPLCKKRRIDTCNETTEPLSLWQKLPVMDKQLARRSFQDPVPKTDSYDSVVVILDTTKPSLPYKYPIDRPMYKHPKNFSLERSRISLMISTNLKEEEVTKVYPFVEDYIELDDRPLVRELDKEYKKVMQVHSFFDSPSRTVRVVESDEYLVCKDQSTGSCLKNILDEETSVQQEQNLQEKIQHSVCETPIPSEQHVQGRGGTDLPFVNNLMSKIQESTVYSEIKPLNFSAVPKKKCLEQDKSINCEEQNLAPETCLTDVYSNNDAQEFSENSDFDRSYDIVGKDVSMSSHVSVNPPNLSNIFESVDPSSFLSSELITRKHTLLTINKEPNSNLGRQSAVCFKANDSFSTVQLETNENLSGSHDKLAFFSVELSSSPYSCKDYLALNSNTEANNKENADLDATTPAQNAGFVRENLSSFWDRERRVVIRSQKTDISNTTDLKKISSNSVSLARKTKGKTCKMDALQMEVNLNQENFTKAVEGIANCKGSSLFNYHQETELYISDEEGISVNDDSEICKNICNTYRAGATSGRYDFKANIKVTTSLNSVIAPITAQEENVESFSSKRDSGVSSTSDFCDSESLILTENFDLNAIATSQKENVVALCDNRADNRNSVSSDMYNTSTTYSPYDSEGNIVSANINLNSNTITASQKENAYPNITDDSSSCDSYYSKGLLASANINHNSIPTASQEKNSAVCCNNYNNLKKILSVPDITHFENVIAPISVNLNSNAVPIISLEENAAHFDSNVNNYENVLNQNTFDVSNIGTTTKLDEYEDVIEPANVNCNSSTVPTGFQWENKAASYANEDGNFKNVLSMNLDSNNVPIIFQEENLAEPSSSRNDDDHNAFDNTNCDFSIISGTFQGENITAFHSNEDDNLENVCSRNIEVSSTSNTREPEIEVTAANTNLDLKLSTSQQRSVTENIVLCNIPVTKATRDEIMAPNEDDTVRPTNAIVKSINKDSKSTDFYDTSVASVSRKTNLLFSAIQDDKDAANIASTSDANIKNLIIKNIEEQADKRNIRSHKSATDIFSSKTKSISSSENEILSDTYFTSDENILPSVPERTDSIFEHIGGFIVISDSENDRVIPYTNGSTGRKQDNIETYDLEHQQMINTLSISNLENTAHSLPDVNAVATENTMLNDMHLQNSEEHPNHMKKQSIRIVVLSDNCSCSDNDEAKDIDCVNSLKKSSVDSLKKSGVASSPLSVCSNNQEIIKETSSCNKEKIHMAYSNIFTADEDKIKNATYTMKSMLELPPINSEIGVWPIVQKSRTSVCVPGIHSSNISHIYIPNINTDFGEDYTTCDTKMYKGSTNHKNSTITSHEFCHQDQTSDIPAICNEIKKKYDNYEKDLKTGGDITLGMNAHQNLVSKKIKRDGMDTLGSTRTVVCNDKPLRVRVTLGTDSQNKEQQSASLPQIHSSVPSTSGIKRPAPESVKDKKSKKRCRPSEKENSSAQKKESSKRVPDKNHQVDAKEIADNTDPRWALYNFSKPQDCFEAVRNQWCSSFLPNPHEDITRRLYDKRITNTADGSYVISGNNRSKVVECLSIYDEQIYDVNRQIENLKSSLDLYGSTWDRRTISQTMRKLRELYQMHHQLRNAWDEARKFYTYYKDPKTHWNAWFLTEYKRNEIKYQQNILQSYKQFYGYFG